jgi:hypothetical protein
MVVRIQPDDPDPLAGLNQSRKPSSEHPPVQW